jgi:transglutaminase-like putative cysteine protease
MGCTARYLKVHGHVWAQVYNPGDRWYDLDTAMNVYFGERYFEGGTGDWDYPS